MSFIENKKEHKNIIDNIVTKQVYEFFTEFLPKIGFEEREGQQDMSLDICEAMRDGEHIMVEAGVGIGKSYAYLLPLLFYNREVKEPVVISTSTISLQEQLMEDILALSKMMNYFPEVTLAKGMTHFACLHRLDEYGGRAIFEEDRKKIMDYERLKSWSMEVGDRAMLQEDIHDDVWNQINVRHCLYNKCKYFKQCIFIKKRDRMANTDGILLCNHDLLIVDSNKKRRNERPLLTEKIKYIVIDEAHNLEEKARGVLQEEITYKKAVITIDEGKYFLKKAHKNKCRDIIDSLHKNMEVYFKILADEINKSMKEGNFQGTEMSKFSFKKIRLGEFTRKILSDIDEVIKEITVADIGATGEYDYFESYQDELIDEFRRMRDIIYNIQYDALDTLTWGEFGGKDARIDTVKIVAAPKSIDKAIGELFFRKKRNDFDTKHIPKVILTSATLTDRKEGELHEQYSYMEKNIGFPWKDGRGIFSEPKESPFDYVNNTIIYYKNKMPHPIKEKDSYLKVATEEALELIKVTEGKTLILFSSKEDMRYVYREMKRKNLQYKLLKQSSHSSQEKVVNEFKEDEDSILLGTGVFWEGINLPGKTLSQVIVFRLPFPVPDPIIEYKRSICENPLLEVNVPEMIIKMRQGVGRLIRSIEDTGVVSILDPRIGNQLNMPYREVIWESLWECRRTSEIGDIEKFYDEKILPIENKVKDRKIKNETFGDFTLNKYFNSDELVRIHSLKSDKNFQMNALKIRKWIKGNERNINEKTAEIAGIFKSIYRLVMSGYSNESIEKNGCSILNEIEKCRRKMLIWKRRRINIREEEEILEMLSSLQKLAKYKRDKDIKFRTYLNEYKGTHKVLCCESDEKFSECFVKKDSIAGIHKGDKVVLFEYDGELVNELVNKEVECEILIFEFERELFIKEKR